MFDFHNEYAMSLEWKARECFGCDGRNRQFAYDADGIELGAFLEAMVYILRCKSSYLRNNIIDEFISDYSQLFGKKSSEIDENDIKNAYERFNDILLYLQDEDEYK